MSETRRNTSATAVASVLTLMVAACGGGARTIPAPVYNERYAHPEPAPSDRADPSAPTAPPAGLAAEPARRAPGAADDLVARPPAAVPTAARGPTAGPVPPTRATGATGDAAPVGDGVHQEPSLGATDDLPIGAGDLIEVSVLQVPELARLQLRVPQRGSVALPLLGAIPVVGYTPAELEQEIRARLMADYMHNPQVSVLVIEQLSGEPVRTRQQRRIGGSESPSAVRIPAQR